MRVQAGVLLLLATATQAATAVELNNGIIRAQFGDGGLTALASASNQFRFTRDGFSLAVDGRTINSDTLAKPAMTREGAAIRYRYVEGELAIEVIYEVRPLWGFVSKQLRVLRSQSQPIRVGRVAVFRTSLVDQVRDQYVCAHPSERLGTRDCGGFLRFDGRRGLLALVQNPFLKFERDGGSFEISYEPDLEWNPAWGPFESDRGVLAPYTLSGRMLPAEMIPEWKVSRDEPVPGMDTAEVEAFQNVVRAFLLDHHRRPVNIFVGWCVNDYQIDISTPEGRAEYKRVIDRAAEMGAQHVLFAPANTAISLRAQSTDDWSWENLLWLGLGQKIRTGEWKIDSDAIPASVAEMLKYAGEKNTKLVAYVYPVLGFLARQHPEWLVPGAKPERANLGLRSYQDWLIEALVRFAHRTGISGYSFDHTFLTFNGTSRYAQWRGWRRVMEELRIRMPDVIIDGRQAYQLYGPWGWLAGTYPHPTATDEQPESFVPFPDLHFDRVSANRLRYTTWRYRNFDFAPSELVPGFITHQTPRIDDKGELPVKIVADARTGLNEQIALSFRARDWDYLGWRFSLLSSIGTAGLNNVLNMIPARDLEEYRNFPDSDKAEFRRWIDWTAQNREFLRHTRTILGQPAIGRVDGTSAIVGDKGYIFLFNPNSRRLNAEFALDSSIGLVTGEKFVLKELAPLEGRRIPKPGTGHWSLGDRVSIGIDGTTAMVVEVVPATRSNGSTILFGAPGSAKLNGRALELTGLRGEAGTVADLLVSVPAGTKVLSVKANGRAVPFESEQPGLVRVRTRFGGAPFRHSQLVEVDGASDGVLTGRFLIPGRVFQQLSERKKRWPIPWTAEDYRTTWLAPERLLLFVQMAEPDDRMQVSMRLDGQEYPLQKAYSSVRTHRASFVGYYADVTALHPDHEYSLELRLPNLEQGRLQAILFDNVETEYTSVIEP